VAKIGECALDPVLAPGGIFTGHPQKEFDGLFGDRRAPEYLAAIAVIPLLGHQLPMPTKDGVGCHDGGDLLQGLATQYFSFDDKAAPLVIGKQDGFLTEFFF